MHTLNIDLETYSSVSLKKEGIYKYVKSEDFEILLLAYSIDEGEVKCVDLASGEDFPEEFLDLIGNPKCIKKAFNAQFEIACLNEYIDPVMDLNQWECTMVKASMLGWPLSLDAASKAMGLVEKKEKEGAALIRYFTIPCKPTKANGGRTRNMPWHDPFKWSRFKHYNIQDVVVEMAIGNKVNFFNIPEHEQRNWRLDQKINNQGIMLDVELVHQAIHVNNLKHDKLVQEAMQLTGLENPNSIKQLKEWFTEQHGEAVESLTKESIKGLLGETDNDTMKRMLEIRQEMAKSSVKKYISMRYCYGLQDRARGLLQFYGANKTGRWSGRLIQVQNLPQNKIEDLDLAREVVRSGDLEVVELLFGNVSDLLSQLIRTAFIAPPGKLLLPTDFSAIEARVIAWFAGETWRLDIFKTHGKIYEASASQMFKIPIETVTKDIRAKGKVAELALGYQGSVGAMEKMGALKMGLKEEELLPIVKLWRAASPNIVRLWYNVEKCAMKAVEDPGKTIALGDKLKFQVKNNTLFIKLPSGRCLSYVRPRLKENGYDKTVIEFEGLDQITGKWCKQQTYGGKLVENIVQGTARDLLADAMWRLDEAGFDIVMHVHDEIVLEVPDDGVNYIPVVDEIMGTEIPWAKGLPLKAESFVSRYYKK